ncbi:MAG: hypothetical protein H7Z75_22925 [Ferruginibacter sp.]|nr:hypothetical protein [Cytophagales bacterium]
MKSRTKQIVFSSPLVVLLMVLSLVGCRKLKELATIKVSSSSTFDIPGAVALSAPYSFVTPDVDNPNTGKAWLVSSAELEKVTLTIQSPAGQAFRFMQSVRFFLQADGLPEVEVANRTNIDNGIGNTLELDVTGAELKEYLKKDKFRLRTEVLPDETVLEPVKIKSDLGFRVTVVI